MNDEQLERAAKRYCELLGIDPREPDDMAAPGYTGPTYATPVYPPKWRGALSRIRDFAAMLEAVEHAKNFEQE